MRRASKQPASPSNCMRVVAKPDQLTQPSPSISGLGNDHSLLTLRASVWSRRSLGHGKQLVTELIGSACSAVAKAIGWAGRKTGRRSLNVDLETQDFAITADITMLHIGSRFGL